MPHNSNMCSSHGMGRHKVDYLTTIQQQILRYIREAIAEHGEAPTVVEIGAAVRLSSRSSVVYQLNELEAKGKIVRERHRPRGIRLT